MPATATATRRRTATGPGSLVLAVVGLLALAVAVDGAVTAGDLTGGGLRLLGWQAACWARIMGAWFLGTFLFSIPAYFFYDPLLNHADYVVGSGEDVRVAVGGLLEILLAISGIATAVVIFPIVKRVNESVALGYIASRTVESILILVGVVSLMSVVGLRHVAGGANNSGALIDVARGLLAVHERTALLGPQFCAGLGNGILLGYVMWRSRLLPRPMVMIGLIGGPLALLVGIGVLLGANPSGLPRVLGEDRVELAVRKAVRVLGLGQQPHEVDDVDVLHLQVRQLAAQDGGGRQRLQGGDLAGAGEDDVREPAGRVLGARPVPDPGAPGTVQGGLLHRHPVRLRLLAATTTLT